jgi:hypothetical protein
MTLVNSIRRALAIGLGLAAVVLSLPASFAWWLSGVTMPHPGRGGDR